MGENLNIDVAFSYLSDLKRSFLNTYEIAKVKNAFAYQLKEFSENIRRLARSYEINPTSKISMLKDKLTATSEILHENVERLLQKNEKLSIIAQKSNRLLETSDDFIKNIQEIKKRQKMRYYKYAAMIVLFCLLVAGVIYLMF